VTARLSDDDTLPPDVAKAFGGLMRAGAMGVVDVAGESLPSATTHENQDAWGMRTASTFVVADGMGGRPGGDVAATTAVAALLDELDRDGPVDWTRAMGRANRAVMDAAARIGHGKIGTTVAVVRCRHGRISVAHVGDTRIYRIRGAAFEVLTSDHSVRGDLEAAGVRPANVAITRSQLAGLTGYLGDDEAWRRFAVRNLACLPGDRLVLCTDGVHRATPRDAWTAAAEHDTCAGIAAELVAAARRAGATDDATALVVRLGKS
jgi:serine/threonine protein phosphatase PrpC